MTEDVDAQANDLYEDAVEYIKSEKYDKAKEKLLELKEIYPHYKSSQQYLKLVEEQIVEERFYYERLKELEEKEAEQKEKEARLKVQIDLLYDEAVKLYKNGDYEAAKAMFEDGELVYPGYKGAGLYLLKIDQDIEMKRLKNLFEERKQQEVVLKEKATQIYNEGLRFYKQRKYDFAKPRFEDVNEMLPGFKSVEKYLALVDEKIIKEEARVKKELKEAVEKKLAQEMLEERQ